MVLDAFAMHDIACRSEDLLWFPTPCYSSSPLPGSRDVMVPYFPTRAHERALASAFADLADVLVADRDVSATLRRLCRHSVELLHLTTAEVLLTVKGQWTVSTTSEGPAPPPIRGTGDADPDRYCVRTSTPILLPDVAAGGHAWPEFAAEVRKQGYASAYALPMRLRSAAHGVLGLFDVRPDSLSPDGIQIGQALADTLMAGIVQHWALHDAGTRAGQLQEALDSRVVIEQAKGVLAQRGSIDVDQAFLLLRSYARSHSQSLHGLAGRLIGDGRLADDILHCHHT
jgi:hypothetical protein